MVKQRALETQIRDKKTLIGQKEQKHQQIESHIRVRDYSKAIVIAKRKS